MEFKDLEDWLNNGVYITSKEEEMPPKHGSFEVSMGGLILQPVIPKIKDVIFNNPATIVIWADGTKTVVKVKKKEKYDKRTGLAMCICKKYYGEKFHRIFKDWCEKS